MATANLKVVLDKDIKSVWEIVTSLDNYLWRSDLSKIDVLEVGKKFIEYSKEGYATTFTITTFDPMRRYEFDIDNNNMRGYWSGIFSKTNDNKTKIEFTEYIMPKKWMMKPFVGIYLKKQQDIYIADLRKALERK